MKPTLEQVVAHALEEAPTALAPVPGHGPWMIPRDAQSELVSWIAARVLAYYLATAGIPAKIELSEGLCLLELAHQRALMLGAVRSHGGLYIFQAPIVPPVKFVAVLAFFEPGGVLWALATAENTRAMATIVGGRRLLIPDVESAEGGLQTTLELVEGLRVLSAAPKEEGRAPGSRASPKEPGQASPPAKVDATSA